MESWERTALDKSLDRGDAIVILVDASGELALLLIVSCAKVKTKYSTDVRG
jgi:hypothetical protein